MEITKISKNNYFKTFKFVLVVEHCRVLEQNKNVNLYCY